MSFYDTLGVAKNASQDDIKKAYRKLAMKHHPDRNQGDKDSEEKFKEIQKAYDILSDDNKRAYYDQTGQEPGQQGPSGFNGGFNGGFNDDDLAEFMRSHGFGFGGPRRQPSPSDKRFGVNFTCNLTMQEAFEGIKQYKIKTFKYEMCDDCHGHGGETEDCVYCKGTGVRTQAHGNMMSQSTCNVCQGTGKKVSKKCKKCSDGFIKKPHEFNIDIPAGVDSLKQNLQIDRNTVLQLTINVKQSHGNLERVNDYDIKTSVPISYYDLVTGVDKLKVKVFDAEYEIKVPAYTDINKMMRLSGKGFKVPNTSKSGDIYVKIDLKKVEHSKSEKEQLKSIFVKE